MNPNNVCLQQKCLDCTFFALKLCKGKEIEEPKAMSFSTALEAVKRGDCIARRGWNGKNMHVSMVSLYTADNIPMDNKCLVLFNVHGKYNTWVPSITDILAEDWEVVG